MFDDETTNNKSLNQTPVYVIYLSIVHRKVLVNKKSNKNSGGYVRHTFMHLHFNIHKALQGFEL